MNKLLRPLFFLICLLTVACGTQTSTEPTLDIQAAPQVQYTNPPAQAVEPVENGAEPAGGYEVETAQANPESYLADSGCLDDITGPVAQSIAEQFPQSTSYAEVGSWFCSGYGFEDILAALQTEPLVSAEDAMSAEEMLELLNQGFTWEEIWKVLDLTD